MDSDIAIRAEGLGKKYIIGHQSAERGATLRDTIVRGVGELTRMGKAMVRGQQIVAGDELEEFWALRDLDFEIKRGDVVGVIGRNGAGKSTLLKVLSRITEPTEGRVQINGRVASLLEVGTGFHPELSGRENIYLNGAILGMTRAEIRRKFDEIVAFSEVEKFLDTPVKRYSSGMYVRLAFAVAAHLEPEILIVDEVLAVGDAEFQKKCLGKMQDVAGEGRTVIFVSHNLATISSLCPQCILLDAGKIEIFAAADETIEKYAESNRTRYRFEVVPHEETEFKLTVGKLTLTDYISNESKLAVELTLFSPDPFIGAMNIYLKDEMLRPIGACSLGGMGSVNKIRLGRGANALQLCVEYPRVAEVIYLLDIDLHDKNRNRVAFFENAIEIAIVPLPDEGCAEVLRQSWGFGSLWLKAKLR